MEQPRPKHDERLDLMQNFCNLDNIASGGAQFMGSILGMAGIGKD